MLNFKPLTLSQIPLMKEYFSRSEGRICDQTLGGAVMWRNSFATEYALCDDILFLRSQLSPEQSAFTVPLGGLEKGIALLKEHCKTTGEELLFCSVCEEDKDRLLALFPESILGAPRTTAINSIPFLLQAEIKQFWAGVV